VDQDDGPRVATHQPGLGTDEPIDRGDLIDDFPVVELRSLRPDAPDRPSLDAASRRVIVTTQTCELANTKATMANVAEVFDADFHVGRGTFKPADVRGPLRGGREHLARHFAETFGRIGLPRPCETM
jgi:hypothetical protein